MISSFKEILFKYFLKNELENQLKPYNFLYYQYLNWKEANFIECCCCKELFKKELRCQICQIYYYCNSCWDDYTYYCFYCNTTHCFVCNVKRKSCKICYRLNRN